MVNLIEGNLCVDTTHVISTGFSYGAGMTYEIACARAKVFHAARDLRRNAAQRLRRWHRSHRILADGGPYGRHYAYERGNTYAQ